MSYTAYVAEPASEKILLVEIDTLEPQEVWIDLQPGIWYADRGIRRYNRSFGYGSGCFGFGAFGTGGVADLTDGHPVARIRSLYAGDTWYTEASSLSSVVATDTSFWFETAAKRLYVHFPNHAPPHCFRDDLKLGVSQGFGSKGAYYDDIYYDPRVLSVPQISRSKDPLFFGKISFDGGTVALNNADGEFDTFQADYDVYGAVVRILLGFEDNAYTDFKTMYEGYLEDLRVDEQRMELRLNDKRKLLSRAVPVNVFNKTDYPNLHDDDVDKPIPLAYGDLRNVPVTCVNRGASAASYTFKICDTTFHAIKSIDAVYVEGGTARTSVAWAGTSLTDATFTLTAGVFNYESDEVFVDIMGYAGTGANVLDFGNCQAALPPQLYSVGGTTTTFVSDATWERSAEQAYQGKYSYRLTKTAAVGSAYAVARFYPSSITGMRGLTAGKTYQLTAYAYCPSDDGPGALGHVFMHLVYYTPSGATYISDSLTGESKDAWCQLATSAVTLPADCSSVAYYAALHTDATAGVIAYWSNIRLVSMDDESFPYRNGLEALTDLLANHYNRPFTSTFYDTADWAIARDGASNIAMLIEDPTEGWKIIELVSASMAGNFIVQDNGTFNFRAFNAGRAVDQSIEHEELLGPLEVLYDTQQVLSSVRVGYNRDWAEGEFQEYLYNSSESVIADKFKAYSERTFETLLPTSAEAAIFAETIMAISGNARPILRARTKMQSIDRELSDMVNVEYRTRNRAFVGTMSCEVIGKTVDLDAMTVELELRKT